jgi:hypothetical protein
VVSLGTVSYEIEQLPQMNVEIKLELRNSLHAISGEKNELRLRN